MSHGCHVSLVADSRERVEPAGDAQDYQDEATRFGRSEVRDHDAET